MSMYYSTHRSSIINKLVVYNALTKYRATRHVTDHPQQLKESNIWVGTYTRYVIEIYRRAVRYRHTWWVVAARKQYCALGRSRGRDVYNERRPYALRINNNVELWRHAEPYNNICSIRMPPDDNRRKWERLVFLWIRYFSTHPRAGMLVYNHRY